MRSRTVNCSVWRFELIQKCRCLPAETAVAHGLVIQLAERQCPITRCIQTSPVRPQFPTKCSARQHSGCLTKSWLCTQRGRWKCHNGAEVSSSIASKWRRLRLPAPTIKHCQLGSFQWSRLQHDGWNESPADWVQCWLECRQGRSTAAAEQP